jgi:signal transduction histidine kinase
MVRVPNGLSPGSDNSFLLPYVAELELEVDRLRTQGAFVEHAARDAVVQVRMLCGRQLPVEPMATVTSAIKAVVDELADVLCDLHEQPGYHPMHDQVTVIAIRPLIEQIFRWQQRLTGAAKAELRLTLQTEHVNWFPARLRHILNSLISNALRYRDPTKGESRVGLDVCCLAGALEFRIFDNGVGISEDRRIDLLELMHRAAPARAAGLGVGLAVVKLLIEQSGGELTVESLEGQGTCFKATLPVFDVDDFLDSTCKQKGTDCAPALTPPPVGSES